MNPRSAATRNSRTYDDLTASLAVSRRSVWMPSTKWVLMALLEIGFLLHSNDGKYPKSAFVPAGRLYCSEPTMGGGKEFS